MIESSQLISNITFQADIRNTKSQTGKNGRNDLKATLSDVPRILNDGITIYWASDNVNIMSPSFKC